jgi:hypothetical protein
LELFSAIGLLISISNLFFAFFEPLCRDMLSIMEDYGSEVSDTTMPRRPRKLEVQRASVVRQFRRWNPNFLRHFVHKDGKWVPKLGKMGELARRERVRREAAQARKQQQVQKMQKSSSKDLPKNSR